MASIQANNMKFYKTGNAHLIQRHARASSSALTMGVAKRKQTKPTSDCFSMIFIDCDDTLIPSKLQRYLYKNLGIDIFKLYKRSMLKRFQYDIIYAIEAIRETFISHYNEEIKIAVVSNASSKWLKATILNRSEDAYFKILSSYFADSGIEIKSAIEETFDFLCRKFGTTNKQKVHEMIAMALDNDNAHQSKWMLKYTTYSSIINRHKRKLKKKCRKIVGIGDGETELEAIKHYSQTFGVGYMALQFIKNGTFSQLSYEWKYIRDHFWSVISDMDSHKSLNVFYFDYVLKNDNNEYFTGHNQLTGIRTYFEKWVRIHALSQQTEKDKNAVLKWMCTRIHIKMRGNDPCSQHMISFKRIIKQSLCANQEFDRAFDNYYKQVRHKSHIANNKRRKSIDESKISDDAIKHKDSSVCSQGTITTNSPYSNKSCDDHNVSVYSSDAGDYVYFSPKSQDVNEDNSYSSKLI